ncbi:hypothetical protein RYZ26_13615 [Terasakiella sp. A23]|uniref:hypothetical protein n=1 Tax=Terasakiella sp. FCG-A23 TaxID=3080561 RepID=UPI00295592BE|nr:hypothetical protein [Terasakiella sp. A23]MDV7340639.1 hypothetical protein [Terasakiella sp. A23]
MQTKKHRKLKVTRRHVVAGLASLPFMASFKPTFALAGTPEPDKFIYASSILCGIKMDKSYIQLSNLVWAAITNNDTEKDHREWHRLIDRVAKLPASATSKDIKRAIRPLGRRVFKKAQLLAKVWYTGRIAIRPVTPKDQFPFKVISYDDALVWIACDFTKPPVTCGGHFGYWQHPFTGRV